MASMMNTVYIFFSLHCVLLTRRNEAKRGGTAPAPPRGTDIPFDKTRWARPKRARPMRLVEEKSLSVFEVEAVNQN